MAQKTSDVPEEMKRLQDAIHGKNVKDALSVLQKEQDKTILKSNIRNYRCQYQDGEKTTNTGDTILHLAAALLDESHSAIIEEIVKLSPDLLASGKKLDTHKGQTPLHILIVRKQTDTLRRIKYLLLPDDKNSLQIGDTVKNNISNPIVAGTMFRETIMEGELPHIVAALTLDKEIAEIMIEMTSTHIKAENSKGKTIYHCLIEHAARNPEKTQEVITMWDFLASYKDDKNVRIQNALGSQALRRTNFDHLRPLQLAAKLGVAELFNKILDSEKMQNVEDRLFDSNLYDISVIDTVAHFKVQREKEKTYREKEEQENANRNQVLPLDIRSSSQEAVNVNKDVTVGKEVTTKKYKWSQSVLEMLCNRKVAKNKHSVFQIIRHPAVKMLIDLKWNFSLPSILAWAIIHFYIMVWYSAYAIVWSVVAFPSNTTNPATTDTQRTFVSVSSILCFLVDIPYLLITILLIISRCIRPNPCDYIKHDLEYIVMLFLFSFGLLIDSIWHQIYLEHGVSFLLISVLSGWWFCIFFIRAYEPMSFYVAMIQKVIFGDLLRFGLFIVLSLVSFSIALQVLFQGMDVPTAFDDENTTELLPVFGRTMLINIKLMFGLGDIEVLHEAREPVMAYIVYLVYVIMTYLVLLNSLIAMISETCATVRENERIFYHTQRLYVILFLEEIWYPFWRRFDCFVPKVPFELRDKLVNNRPIYRSYFIRMTDESINNENSIDTAFNNYQQLQPKTETSVCILQQPFFEEYLDNNKKTEFRLKWKDEKL